MQNLTLSRLRSRITSEIFNIQEYPWTTICVSDKRRGRAGNLLGSPQYLFKTQKPTVLRSDRNISLFFLGTYIWQEILAFEGPKDPHYIGWFHTDFLPWSLEYPYGRASWGGSGRNRQFINAKIKVVWICTHARYHFIFDTLFESKDSKTPVTHWLRERDSPIIENYKSPSLKTFKT